jgi:lipase chaperone LimK
MPYLAEQFFGEEDRLEDFALDRLRGTTDGSPETVDADAPPESE